MPDAHPPPSAVGPRARNTEAWRLGGRTAIVVGCAVAVTGFMIFPLILHQLGGTSWSRLGDIGQAYGTLAAILTGLSLVAVAVSVSLQARDARTNHEHGARMLHLELVRMALNDPDLFRPPGEPWHSLPDTEIRRQLFTNLWVMLWRTFYRLNYMSESALRIAVSEQLFGDHFGRRFWERSRGQQIAGARGRRERKFYRIIDDEYRDVLTREPMVHQEATTRPRDRRLKFDRRVALLAGGALGALVAHAIARSLVSPHARSH